MTARAVSIAVLDALPFAIIGAVAAVVGGRRLAGWGFAVGVGALVGVALLVGLAGISLRHATERPFVLVRTTVDILLRA